MKPKPEHSVIVLVATVFLFAGIALFVEQREQRLPVSPFSLCPLCGQEVRP